MQSNKDKLLQIKNRITHKDESNINLDGLIFQLASELGCIGDILGREYEVIYDDDGRISLIRQKPFRAHQLLTLFSEGIKESKRRRKEMRKNQPKIKPNRRR